MTPSPSSSALTGAALTRPRAGAGAATGTVTSSVIGVVTSSETTEAILSTVPAAASAAVTV